MARKIEEIQQLIIKAKRKHAELNGLNSASKVAVWRLWTFIVATVIWTLEMLFDRHKAETMETLRQMKPHSLIWYRNKARSFQYGHPLVYETDCYNNRGRTEEEIEKSKIVKHAAVTEVADTSYGVRLRIKVAKEVSDELAPLAKPELEAFREYCERVKDAGNKLQVDSLPPDKLQITYDIYYDPLVLDAQGKQIDGTDNTPVQHAINTYLKELPFNGEFRPAAMTDKLQKVEGVEIPELQVARVRWGQFDWRDVDARYIPDAGYLRLYKEDDFTLHFKPYKP